MPQTRTPPIEKIIQDLAWDRNRQTWMLIWLTICSASVVKSMPTVMCPLSRCNRTQLGDYYYFQLPKRLKSDSPDCGEALLLLQPHWLGMNSERSIRLGRSLAMPRSTCDFSSSCPILLPSLACESHCDRYVSRAQRATSSRSAIIDISRSYVTQPKAWHAGPITNTISRSWSEDKLPTERETSGKARLSCVQTSIYFWQQCATSIHILLAGSCFFCLDVNVVLPQSRPIIEPCFVTQAVTDCVCLTDRVPFLCTVI